MLEFVFNQRAQAGKTNAFIEARKITRRTLVDDVVCDMMKKKGERNEHLTVVANLPKKDI